jgi:hypothetical protein
VPGIRFADVVRNDTNRLFGRVVETPTDSVIPGVPVWMSGLDNSLLGQTNTWVDGYSCSRACCAQPLSLKPATGPRNQPGRRSVPAG